MDNFELKPEPKAKPKKPIIWNILTVVVLLATCGLAYLFLQVFMHPELVPSSLQPVVLPTPYQTPTPTPTIILLPSTWTPTLTIQPSATKTKIPTWTPVSALITPSITMTPTITTSPTITSTVMPATAAVTYQASTIIHPESACNWMGVGGKVLDANKQPLAFQTVQLGGSLDGKDITTIISSPIALSGSSPAYGTSGFEFKLGVQPVASTQTLWIQLFDNKGTPLTGKIFFDTFTDCSKNSVMIIFTKTH